MAFSDMVIEAQTYFPNLQVKYKDQNTFMQILGKILFFNSSFMTSYTTTIGSTIYLPNEAYTNPSNSENVVPVFIHECCHMYDEKRVTSIPYTVGYLFPQILAPFVWLLAFFVSWKILLPISLFLLLPLPAPWRTYFERRAYFVQMYVLFHMFGEPPTEDGTTFSAWFKDGSYYWMWIFGQNSNFVQEEANILAGTSEVESDPNLKAMVNNLIAAAQK